MTNTQRPHNTDDQTGEGKLRDPDRTDHGEREITFVWDLGEDPDGGVRQTVLSIMHHKGRPGAFSATVLNRTERKTPVGTSLEMGSVLEWTRIASAQVARYSDARLQTFAIAAYSKLHDLYEQGDEQALRYFRVEQ
jgi:hypothetical protein